LDYSLAKFLNVTFLVFEEIVAGIKLHEMFQQLADKANSRPK